MSNHPSSASRPVALVTGAGSGIGRETARICAREGARVGVLDVDGDAADATVAAIASDHGEGAAVALPADLCAEEQVAGAVARLRREWGGLDVVIGCAGIQLAGQDDRADRLELAVWQIALIVPRLLSYHALCTTVSWYSGMMV